MNLCRLAPIFLLTLFALLPACAEKEAEKPIGKPNPASEHCIKAGGQPQSKKLPSGDGISICVMPDGRECDAWILMKENRCEAIRTEPTP